ncbi:Uncharacterised protein [Mycobacterium tuberculosis]|uniref:Uncharacterized protein n=1 Tax=Mycobacterium tuberculosis TaxID=1773 RepID=A0A916LFX3_MYCTX|nr:Uncharacterised protein [Mycobacterium tuberculosis]
MGALRPSSSLLRPPLTTSVRSATAVACCIRFNSVDALRIPPSP